MIKILKFFKTAFTDPVCMIFLGCVLMFFGGMTVGFGEAKREYQLSVAKLERKQLEEKNAQIEAHNVALSKVYQETLAQQKRADKAELGLLQAQTDLTKKTKEIKKEVIKYVEKDNSRCDAFDSDGLQLYTKALGYDDRETKPAGAGGVKD